MPLRPVVVVIQKDNDGEIGTCLAPVLALDQVGQPQTQPLT